jgi:GNAT superfamily N-acetyltransferase
MEYTIRVASVEDAPTVHTLIFANPDKHLRARPVGDVSALARAGTLWVVCPPDGDIVGACYVSVPEAKPNEVPEAEWGGLFVSEQHRGRGLGTILGVVALASYCWDHWDGDQSKLRLIGHVHVANPSPRPTLAKLGFVQQAEPITVSDELVGSGFDHMPRNEDGKIQGYVFDFPPEQRLETFKQMAQFLRGQNLGDNVFHFELPFGMDADELDTLAQSRHRGP